jgi:AraC-like DNA-binding protein
MQEVGISPAEYADPDTRIHHGTGVEWAKTLVETSGDPTIGLRAGEMVQPGDFDTLERAVSACSTLREANECYARYVHLMNEAVEIDLRETKESGILEYRITDGVAHPPVVTDFFMALLVAFGRQLTGRNDLFSEVRFTHGPTTYVDAYERFFRSKIVFDAPLNAILSPLGSRDAPMRWANPQARQAFELRARELLERLERSQTVAGKVRDLVLSGMHHDPLHMDMEAIARKLAISVATLRRRLTEEGASYSGIVDEARHELAMRYLGEAARSVGEVAFLLGFADVASFHRAFKRWTGTSPAEFRSRETRAHT